MGRKQGRHGGSRRGKKSRPSFRPRLLGLSVGVTLAVVAWGYLVYAAIDFGAQARGGTTQAWWFLGLAAVGAVACLFVGLMLVVWLLRALGISSGPVSKQPAPDPEPAVDLVADQVVGPQPIPEPKTLRAPRASSASGGKRAAR